MSARRWGSIWNRSKESPSCPREARGKSKIPRPTRRISSSRAAGLDLNNPMVGKLHALSREILNLPRHLGQHSGGLVICQGQLDSIVPIEPATMPGRVIVQWDKEDCADLGLIKVDLLGLGMMAALKDSINADPESLPRRSGSGASSGRTIQWYTTPLQKADTVGLFQVESRAQMSCLPRLQTREIFTTSWCRWRSSARDRLSER